MDTLQEMITVKKLILTGGNVLAARLSPSNELAEACMVGLCCSDLVSMYGFLRAASLANTEKHEIELNERTKVNQN